MSNWSQLPTEILSKIFGILDASCLDTLQLQEGVSQWMLVCKNWCRIAQTLLYEDITVLSIKQHDTFLTCMSHCSTGLNQLVRCFMAIPEITSVKLEEDLGLILNALPNLRYLQGGPQKASFFTRLLFELYTFPNRPVQLLKIPGFSPESEQDARSYQYAVLTLKKTLTSMFLPDYCIQPYRITTPLEDFKNLSQLEVCVSSLSQMYDMGTIASRCPNLNSLSISRHARYNPSGEDQIKAIDTTCVQSVYHVVSLRIDASLATASHNIMCILMKLFPQLESLYMYFNPVAPTYGEYERQIQMIPAELWVQFLTYADKIREFYGRGMYMDCLNQVLTETSYNTGLCKEIKVRYSQGNPVNNYGWLPVLNIHSLTMHNVAQHEYVMIGTIVSYTTSGISVHLPHAALIEKIGFQLEHLTMTLNRAFGHGAPFGRITDYDKKPFGHFINHIFTHCPVLRALVITGAELLYSDDGDKEAPPSLKFLHLQNCIIYHQMDFLLNLSRRLPSRLEFMAIDECIFFKRSDDLTPHVEMPFTVIGCLFYSKKKLPVSKYSRLVIKITKVSQKPLYYCLYDQHKLQSLSGQEEFEVCAKDEETHAIQITCANVEKLLIRVLGSPVLIFPKEKVEYMNGQHYINSTSEFWNVLI
ncbi:uncharacterized protein EV154DRAFT_517332 [Mucor mucedo]|uniref:uncharacterized protein n=1 Tax=Mucor mucedo TaxID=29922 RepID=UPI00221EB864|nr:uncharacterized protein EV154DRAFT_517332 [Mucor mucedo]KAI7888542.1 hypothetical protein EV154DRAFT_517332 [Mucor mucedo]